jgi:DNA-binding transcriptional MerR regulator
MLRIGDFAKLSRVSVKALRFYDEIGLLRPAAIDRFSGYRYYQAAQLARLNRILALKDLGFSLEQIGGVLDQELSAGQVSALLQLKAQELRERMRQDEDRLRRIETRLKQIEQEDQMPDYEVVIKPVDAMQVASLGGTIPNYDESGPIFDRLFDDVYAYVYRQGVKNVGCGIALYVTPEGAEREIEVEALAPLYEVLQPGDGVRVYELPAVEQMASTVHHGPFATMYQAYGSMMVWLEANGYQITGPCRELYLEYERGGDQNKYVTEIQFPVSKE